MNNYNNRSQTSTRPGQHGQRDVRSRWAQETLDILQQGYYQAPSGKDVPIGQQVERTIREAVLYRPQEREAVQQAAEQQLQQRIATKLAAPTSAAETAESSGLPIEHTHSVCEAHNDPSSPNEHRCGAIIECTTETTLQAAERLAVQEQYPHVMALNFASARNPGGGFLGGSQAQEESLARSSSLYPSIVQMDEMYKHNRREQSCMYSDYMIYSPAVTVFRNDDGSLREQPYAVSMLTAPAVNAGIVHEREPEQAYRIEAVMKQRIRYMLAVAAAHEQKVLVLGAYGCGVFRNDPEQVATWFNDILQGEQYALLFDKIVFAILDRSKQGNVIRPFRQLATV
ncbi:TIGR02452 family protein [Paenibacillus campi]|uniref:TIGR02452 family protein n=1 Tax=Paenibacillus campi TaxID=3106031 RepID=UPI002AFE8C77|nr:TIGR02452 family protein [Paenibacillus sp. SGZ-1014]